MSRYNFVSPGAEAGNAIEKFLMQRELDKRRDMLATLAQQNTQADNERADAALRLQQRSADATTESNRLARENAEGERKFRRASTIATTGLPGVLDADTAGLLRGEGFGTLIKEGQPQQGAFLGNDENQIPQYEVKPGILEFAGGSQYQNARAAEAARASEGEASRQAAAERAREANDNRTSLAQLAAGNRNETAALRNQLTQQQIDAAREKADAAKRAEKNAADAVTGYQGDIESVLNDLIDEQGNLRPEVAGVVGAFDARTPNLTEGSNTAMAKLDHLIGLLDVNKLREMKAQSRTGATGFGALNEKELGILESAGSTLRNRRQGEGAYAAELKRIRDTVHKGQAPTAANADPLGLR
jgi:hypothetical protein